jgi:hypothetical protein
MDNRLPDISLALHAIRQEGRTVRVVPMSWYVEHHADPSRDYLVLADDTYDAWRRAHA